MFRTPVAVAQPVDAVAPADPIPLSVLELDLPAPAVGWLVELDRRGIQVVDDDIGRPSISRDDAKMLLHEQREVEARRREMAAEAERQAIEADRAFRATLNKGVEWWRLPDNMAPGDAMALAAAQSDRQKSVQEELLEEEFGGPQTSMVYRPWPNEE